MYKEILNNLNSEEYGKSIWLNLPVKDIERSKKFFTKIGFKFSDGPGNTPNSAPLLIGSKEVVVMLFEESVFKGFVNQEVSDPTKVSEVVLSIDAGSKEEVDGFVEKVLEAGGSSNHKPYKMDGPMYGCIFNDPDGHKWNVLYMKGM